MPSPASARRNEQQQQQQEQEQQEQQEQQQQQRQEWNAAVEASLTDVPLEEALPDLRASEKAATKSAAPDLAAPTASEMCTQTTPRTPALEETEESPKTEQIKAAKATSWPCLPKSRRGRWACTAGLLLLLGAGAGVAGWLGLVDDVKSVIGPEGSAGPVSDDIEKDERPVIEHSKTGVPELQYIIGLDEESSEDQIMELLLYLQDHNAPYTRLPILGAVEAQLTSTVVAELRSGSWGVVASLERNMEVSDAPSNPEEGPLEITDDDDEVDGAARRLRGWVSDVVRRLQKMGTSTIFENSLTISGSSVASVAWHLDHVDSNPGNGNFDSHYGGSNVDIYILDTGVRRTHSEFGSRVGSAFYGAGSDQQGHGTAMAGAAAGGQYGTANNARIFDVQVLNARGSGTVLGIIRGLEWVASNRVAGRKAVASMSLGGGRSPALDNAVQNLIAQGVPVVVAAGNEGSDACNFSPAATPEALTVGSIGQSGSVSYFSNTGSCVDLYAPGEGIRTASWQGDAISVSSTGPSPACAVAAGAAAQFLEAGHEESELFAAMRSATSSASVLKLPTTTAATTSVPPATTASAPMPAPQPAPTPNASPTPTPATSIPTPVPMPAPQPTPTPVPVPAPQPTPTPLASPTPKPTPGDGCVSGSISRGKERMLKGEIIQGSHKDILNFDLVCTCTTRRCNMDLYLLKKRRNKWRTRALSRSRSSKESLRVRIGSRKGATVMPIAWARRGTATCKMCTVKQ